MQRYGTGDRFTPLNPAQSSVISQTLSLYLTSAFHTSVHIVSAGEKRLCMALQCYQGVEVKNGSHIKARLFKNLTIKRQLLRITWTPAQSKEILSTANHNISVMLHEKSHLIACLTRLKQKRFILKQLVLSFLPHRREQWGLSIYTHAQTHRERRLSSSQSVPAA